MTLEAVRTVFLQSLCRKEANRRTNLIKQCLRVCGQHCFITPQVATDLSVVDGLRKGDGREAPKPREINLQDIEAVLKHVSPVVAAMIEFQRFTGARPGEVCQMTASDITKTDPDVWEYRTKTHKTEYRDQMRIIPTGPKVQAIIEPFLRGNPNHPVFPPCKGATKGYTETSYNRAVHRGCKCAGISEWSVNQLRHYAAQTITREHGPEAARAVLGHSSLNTTEIYLTSDRETARKVMREQR